jgi:5-methylcytosine-specific restriction endonuclease McrA
MNYKSFPLDTQMLVWSKTEGLCWYCGKQTHMNKEMNAKSVAIKQKFTVDHFVSLRYGGTDDLSNLVPACWSCNSSKQKRSITEWKDCLRWKDIGRFTGKQIKWLQSNGIEIPEPPEINFYFEMVGLG